MENHYAVVLVDSTSQALRIEKILIDHGVACKLIPVPRHLSSDCGVCLRIDRDEMQMVDYLINEKKITVQSIEEI